MSHLSTSAGSIFLRESGGEEQPAVLFVHGNSASSAAYERQLNGRLGRRYRLLAMDLPGHGDSANAKDSVSTYCLPGYAKAVAEVVMALELPSVVLVGWSLGGHIVLEASPLVAGLKGVMIFGTPPLGKPPAMDKAFLPHPAMQATFAEVLTEEQRRAYVEAFFAPGFRPIPEHFFRAVARTDVAARRLLGESLTLGDFADELQLINELAVPLAVIHGDRELLVNGEYLQCLRASSLWRGAVQHCPTAGHAPQWECVEEFNGYLSEFLADLRD